MAQSMNDILHPNQPKDPGFPHAPEDWTRATAEATARAEGIQLEPAHWQVIGALQSYFARHERPNVREIHDALDERFHERGGIKFLYGILPGGPVAQGCRLAGLDAPPGSADSSFGSVQ